MIDQLQNDLKNAQLSRDGVQVSTLRLLLSEIKNAQIAKGEKLSDEEIITLLQKEVKKRQQAASSFRSGKREDLALKEETEAKYLENYLPAKLQVEELTKIVLDIINEVGAKNMQDMGKVMAAVMVVVKGRAEGSMVSSLVKEKLSK